MGGARLEEGCVEDLSEATLGLVSSTEFASLVDPKLPSSLPMNARANHGRVAVDACGITALADLDGSYSIHRTAWGKNFTQLSTKNFDTSSVTQFASLGEDYLIVAVNGDNHSLVYRMPKTGGPIDQILSEPLLNGVFGAEWVAQSGDRIFFTTWSGGANFALRRATVADFSTGVLPLSEPIADKRARRVVAWGEDQVFFGGDLFSSSCVPAPNAGCSKEEPPKSSPDLTYLIGTSEVGVYTWFFGQLGFAPFDGAPLSSKPEGVEATDEGQIDGAVSPDGKRVAVVTQGSAGLRLHLIDGADTASPKGRSLPLRFASTSLQDVWTNGRVVVLVWEQSMDTLSIQVQGILWE